MLNTFESLLNFIYPNRCGFCGREISKGKLICSDCYKKVKFSPAYKTFGLSKNYMNVNVVFTACLYDGIIKDGLLRFKRKYAMNAAEYICIELVKLIGRSDYKDDIDYITFVPSSPKSIAANGFNHAQKIAEILSSQLDIPIAYGVIAKKDTNLKQHDQNAADRRLLADECYYLPENPHCDITDKTVLLCDDIITTGSTIRSCSNILYSQGAASVYAAALARRIKK